MSYGYFWCQFPEKWLFSNSKNSCIINVHIEPSSRSLLPLLLFRGTFALQPSSGKHPGMQFDQTPSSTCRFLGPSMYLEKSLLFQTWSKGIWVGTPLLFATFWGDLRWGCATWTPWDSVVSPVWMFVGQVFPHLKNGRLEKNRKKSQGQKLASEERWGDESQLLGQKSWEG